jgi:ribosomal protein S18 acetylase RimI-like enzyme
MYQVYCELNPTVKLAPLAETVEHLWSEQTPFWLIELTALESSQPPVACLWLGSAVDQMTGDHYTHIFLLYVAPAHRRQGLGKMLMHHAEHWTKLQGNHQVGLHVFLRSTSALQLYQRLGYHPQATFLQKPLSAS